jgi:hypothetical protein
MWDVVQIVVPWGVTTWAIFMLLRWDESRLSPEQLSRAWPAVSRVSAVVGFSFLAVPVHFWRTRRGARGVLIGLLWAALVLALDVGVSTAIEWMAGT